MSDQYDCNDDGRTLRHVHLSIGPGAETQFRSLLRRGIPVVVDIGSAKLQGGWHPRDFVRSYGDLKILVVNTETNFSTKSTVKAFFEQFGQARTSTEVLKLKDWPPEKNFRTQFSDHYQSFLDAVPFPDITRPDGVLNMRSHYPKNGVIPDLGPKMYNAYGTEQDNEHKGSTRLHIDVTDAVNIMAHSESFPNGSPGTARWDLFPRESIGKLRESLRAQFSVTEDPVHSQNLYLTPNVLEKLAAEDGIKPFTIYQKPGQAVFIPAGCPHQVSNQTDAVKVACDFLSMENLAVSERLSHDFRRHRLAGGVAQDVLQLHPTLWYAWNGLRELSNELDTEERTTVSESPSESGRSHLNAPYSPSQSD
ncbi:hypothetical protein BV25DRAFT_1807669 [Artomyces pyxidatus]|uniref:Uncharacterized protein n=1 Tax=Artomyces pyxidatus TaxID=48021 RepID=A0ACB8SX79_9AGAM|nr:hypothetical protein BV25DRAFT_1807669 [Artomyces pyxidatus]